MPDESPFKEFAEYRTQNPERKAPGYLKPINFREGDTPEEARALIKAAHEQYQLPVSQPTYCGYAPEKAGDLGSYAQAWMEGGFGLDKDFTFGADLGISRRSKSIIAKVDNAKILLEAINTDNVAYFVIHAYRVYVERILGKRFWPAPIQNVYGYNPVSGERVIIPSTPEQRAPLNFRVDDDRSTIRELIELAYWLEDSANSERNIDYVRSEIYQLLVLMGLARLHPRKNK